MHIPAKASALCVRDDIAICEPDYVVAVATIMRQLVISAYRTETAAKGVPEKARRLYDYLASEEFSASFKEILDCANRLAALDEVERRQHELSWEKRATLLGQLCAAHLRIDAKLVAEVEGRTSPVPATVVVDIPKRNEQRAA